MVVNPMRIAAALLLLAPLCFGQSAQPAPAALAHPHEQLNAVLYTQTAVEREALCLQAYRLARLELDRALRDRSWTAAKEQGKGYRSLPPAVILDIDETVLDNSAEQARLVLKSEAYSPQTWKAWVDKKLATPIPGALAFTKYAASKGVRVVYVTNRRAAELEATRANLEALGFPLAKGEDPILTRDGGSGRWKDDSDKGERRKVVAQKYRILLLVGDDFGDFLSGVKTDVKKLAELLQENVAWVGARWIMLPNAMYGSWEAALYDHQPGKPQDEQLLRKWQALRGH